MKKIIVALAAAFVLILLGTTNTTVAQAAAPAPVNTSARAVALEDTFPTRSWSDFFDWDGDVVGTTLGIGFRKQNDGTGITIESNRLQASGQEVRMWATCYRRVHMVITSTSPSYPNWREERDWGAEPCHEVNDMELVGPDTGGLLVTFEAAACMDSGAHQMLSATWALENSVPYARTIRRDRFTWTGAC